MANPFVHVELMTGDVEKAKAFYGTLFDWNLEDVPGMNYTIVKVGEGTGGGMMACPGPEVSPQWLPYVHVKDVAETLAKARALGATVMHKQPPMRRPNPGSPISSPPCHPQRITAMTSRTASTKNRLRKVMK
jgi:predicted enzyme related to lactoylglutathione lyase